MGALLRIFVRSANNCSGKILMIVQTVNKVVLPINSGGVYADNYDNGINFFENISLGNKSYRIYF